MPRRSCRIPTARLSQAVSAWTGSGACGTSGRMHCAYHGPLSLGATALGHGKPFPPPDRRCCAGWATLPHSAACRNHYRRVQTAGAPSGDSLSLRCACVKGWERAAKLLSPIPPWGLHLWADQLGLSGFVSPHLLLVLYLAYCMAYCRRAISGV